MNHLTARQIAKRAGLSPQVAAKWLSENYEQRSMRYANGHLVAMYSENEATRLKKAAKEWERSRKQQQAEA